MSIRIARASDTLAISSLVKSLAHFYLDDPKKELPDWLAETLTEKAFLKRISEGGFLNYVYERSGSIVGYISLKEPNHLYHLFVSEQFQGNGIARALWEHVQQSVECDFFTLRSSIYAVPVYKKFGFTESGPLGAKDGISFQPMELVPKC